MQRTTAERGATGEIASSAAPAKVLSERAGPSIETAKTEKGQWSAGPFFTRMAFQMTDSIDHLPARLAGNPWIKAASVLFAIVVVAAFLACMAGCDTVSPATQKALQQIRDDNALSVANIQSADQEALQKLKDNLATKATLGQQAPASHPWDALNQSIRELHPWVLYGTIGLAAAAIGVWICSFIFTTHTFLTKFALALSKGAILSLGVLIGLPWGVWCIAFLLGAFLVIYLIEAIRDHFDMRQAMIDTLAAIGIKLGSTSATAVAEAKIMAANPVRVPPVVKPPFVAPYVTPVTTLPGGAA